MPGNIPSFDVLDVIRCFLLLEQQRSRTFLTEHLQLGEGTIRSILVQLKEKGLIIPSNKGHILSKKGVDLVVRIKKQASFYDPALVKPHFFTSFFPLFPKDVVKCCHLFRDYSSLRDIYLLRDHAIRKGADGALILVFSEGRLQFPGYTYPGDLSILEQMFPLQLKKGIVLIVVAETEILAQKGLLNILHNLTPVFNEFE